MFAACAAEESLFGAGVPRMWFGCGVALSPDARFIVRHDHETDQLVIYRAHYCSKLILRFEKQGIITHDSVCRFVVSNDGDVALVTYSRTTRSFAFFIFDRNGNFARQLQRSTGMYPCAFNENGELLVETFKSVGFTLSTCSNIKHIKPCTNNWSKYHCTRNNKMLFVDQQTVWIQDVLTNEAKQWKLPFESGVLSTEVSPNGMYMAIITQCSKLIVLSTVHTKILHTWVMPGVKKVWFARDRPVLFIYTFKSQNPLLTSGYAHNLELWCLRSFHKLDVRQMSGPIERVITFADPRWNACVRAALLLLGQSTPLFEQCLQQLPHELRVRVCMAAANAPCPPLSSHMQEAQFLLSQH